MDLHAEPACGLIDEPVTWRVSDVEPGIPVTLTVSGTDADVIDAPVLLIAGSDDQMWPSETMARAIAARRDAYGHQHDLLVTLADTGHFIRPPGSPTTVDRSADLISGGSPPGIAAGERLAWEVTRAFLDRFGRSERR